MINKIKQFLKRDDVFFILVFLLNIFFFYKAFRIYFFVDDFAFLEQSRISSIKEFFLFFSPIREYSYKPIATEVFYFLIHLFNKNTFLSHGLVFAVYFLGLFYLYKIVNIFFKDKFLAKILVFLYSIHFSHVFQLYWLATFQEIALFTFLIISFYFFLKKRLSKSLIFYFLALLSKETAILFMPFLLLNFLFFKISKNKILKKWDFKKLLPYFFLSIASLFLYKISLSHVTTLDNYRLQFSPKLIFNNAMWYSLWGLGAPSFMPDYFPSIFSFPLPGFFKFFTDFNFSFYLFFLALNLLFLGFLLFSKAKKERKKLLLLTIYCLLSFFIFLGPILLFYHKWMVRLTLPLLFVSLFQAYLLRKIIKFSSVKLSFFVYFFFISYLLSNYFAIKVHEEASTYLLESRITKRAYDIFSKLKVDNTDIIYLYFQDGDGVSLSSWDGSEKLKTSFSDQSFIDFYFPNKNYQAIYSYEEKTPPDKTVIIKADSFF